MMALMTAPCQLRNYRTLPLDETGRSTNEHLEKLAKIESDPLWPSANRITRSAWRYMVEYIIDHVISRPYHSCSSIVIQMQSKTHLRAFHFKLVYFLCLSKAKLLPRQLAIFAGPEHSGTHRM